MTEYKQCRICLEYAAKVYSLFEKAILAEETVASMLSYCTGSEVNKLFTSIIHLRPNMNHCRLPPTKISLIMYA